MTALRDQFGRSIEYLRISVTDRCNLRCLYCMPIEGLPWIAREHLLTDAEIVSVVRQLAPLGLRRIRITGGEPTTRPGLIDLIRGLRALDMVEDIALSTNGVRLAELAAALRKAGVDRVNVSVDSLKPERIRAIARRNLDFSPLAAARAALAAGLDPVKINVVLLRGINDDEIEDLAGLTLVLPLHVRFIELMPVGDLGATTDERIVPSDEVLRRIAALRPVSPAIGPNRGNGPARYFRLDDAIGTIGIITPMTHTYCGSCNRVRLTADGRLRTCLFGEHYVDLRAPLRAGLPLGPFFREALAGKPLEHHLLRRRTGGLRALSEVGG